MTDELRTYDSHEEVLADAYDGIWNCAPALLLCLVALCALTLGVVAKRGDRGRV